MEKITSLFINYFHIKNIYIINIIYSLLFFLILKIFRYIFDCINLKFNKDEKNLYLTTRRNKTVLRIIYFFIIFFIWKEEIRDIITFISFVSAAITLAIRDIIYNYFCGIYIKFIKPIKIEDRIQVGNIIGDVINTRSLFFEILEVNPNTNQSTGKIIYVPNSQIFSETIKNYNTAFKYIWHEFNINIEMDSNVDLAKEIILNILNSNETINEIPKKMQREIKKSHAEYRIYFNKLTPIIYTSIDDNKIILSARFLMHPKKIRIVESEIYEKLIAEFKKNNINFA